MAGGGLVQLVAYGAQDIYLTGNPQITFFKVVYRRYTNFASEAIEQTFAGTFDFNTRVTVQLTRNADVVTKMYLRVILNQGVLNPITLSPGGQLFTPQWAWTPRLGHALIQDYFLEIGGTQIDKQYGDWLNIWFELTQLVGQVRGYNRMIGNVPEMTSLSDQYGFNAPNQNQQYTLNVPLQFFHCRHDGLGIPLIALQYHEVRITFDIAPLNQLIITNYGNGTIITGTSWATIPSIAYASLWVDYIYLDQEERKRFAQATHEYLIEQVQFPASESISTTATRTRLIFNHPCKFLAWDIQLARWITGLRFLAYNSDSHDAMQLLATKRFILAYALIVSGSLQPSSSTQNTVLPNPLLAGNYLTYFNNAAAVFVDPLVLTPDNLTITGSLMPIDVLSLDCATLESVVLASSPGITRNTSLYNNQGSSVWDYVVYDWTNYGLQLDRSENPVLTGLLQLNGHDRFNIRDGNYFNYVQPYQCFTNTPSDGINVYSFALTPQEHQPSGTCNFSRIDNATLQLTIGRALGTSNISASATFSSIYLPTAATLNIYAFNYNVLRVMSGMGGLAYSN